MEPPVRENPDKALSKLKTMVNRQRQFVFDVSMETNHTEALTEQKTKTGLWRHIQWLASEVKAY